MLSVRVIPCLLLKQDGLVKTVRFSDPKYVGDPRNAVKIFNEKEVDELVILDIDATVASRKPRLQLLGEIVSEAFTPVSYGGGIENIDDAQELLNLGIEKLIVCTAAVEKKGFIAEAAARFGSQSVVVCIDAKKRPDGRHEAYTRGGGLATGLEAAELAVRAEGEGAGELMINSIDRDGTMEGYDLDLIRSVTSKVNVPVVACGGAGRIEDLGRVVKEGGASAAAAGSLFVFRGKYRAVLISYPGQDALRAMFG